MSEGESRAHRGNVHSVMLCASLEIAVAKVMAKLECGKNYAVLWLITQAAYDQGVISKEEYELLDRRYSRPLKEVVAENQAKKESSHIPVLSIEQTKENQLLQQKDEQLSGMIAQWNLHPSTEWRATAFSEAEKWKDKLESARNLLAFCKITENEA